MSETFGLSEINELVEALTVAMIEERDARGNVFKAIGATDNERARVIFNARQAGLINGKNEAERNDQIAALLDTGAANGLYWLEKYQAECEEILSMREIDRKSIEAEISLTKAWLYSQSGGQR